ncbi:MAG: DUF4097 family beta strand repeat protein [Clostridia bacterium]|nr:DUF4097 family beta strand repeat protein [Clostridia bacterium]
MNKKEKLKKIGIVLAIVAASLLVMALLLGVLNGLVADGKWSFGWTDYRYDEAGYTAGSGSLPYKAFTAVDVDWGEGLVIVVPCEDTYPSISEESESALTDRELVRWGLSADGGTLQIKHRASSYFFGNGKEKTLTLRIPRKMLSGMQSIRINTKGANVFLDDLMLSTVSVQTHAGALRATDCNLQSLSFSTQGGKGSYEGIVAQSLTVACKNGAFELKSPQAPSSLAISTQGGNVTLTLPKAASFTLRFESEKGSVTSDLPMQAGGNGVYACGNGDAAFSVSTKKGNLHFAIYE